MTAPRKSSKEPADRTLATNRQAPFNYFILERYETGVVLSGTEVKSVRAGKAALRDSHVLVRRNECWLVNCHIPEYSPGGLWNNHTPLRDRKLLLHKREIEKLAVKVQQKGLALIALRMYMKGARVKIEIALARGKKEWDKRASIREREERRETAQAIHDHKTRF
ncbi:MAG TPA: SsrA-binding protein SmpB [Candidatus Acidoferrales bacterium]|nr:SsrA-binding protein SmpB [Candidatus Acidoferrales bacterium]